MTKIWHLVSKFADQNLVTRMEVPRSTVTWNRELERRQAARQVEPGGKEELWSEGFHQHQDSIQTSLHLVDEEDAWQEALDFASIAGNARI